MTTIRDYVLERLDARNDDAKDKTHPKDREDLALEICVWFGVNPDTPAEWATDAACLNWLRDRHIALVAAEQDFTTPHVRYILALDDQQDERDAFTGATLHAALIAACQAVQEAEQ